MPGLPTGLSFTDLAVDSIYLVSVAHQGATEGLSEKAGTSGDDDLQEGNGDILGTVPPPNGRSLQQRLTPCLRHVHRQFEPVGFA